MEEKYANSLEFTKMSFANCHKKQNLPQESCHNLMFSQSQKLDKVLMIEKIDKNV